MAARRRDSLKEYYSIRDRYLQRRGMGLQFQPVASWWRHRHLFYTAISLLLVLVAGFTVRGLYRFLPQTTRSAEQQEVSQSESETPDMDYETAKRLFSGQIPVATGTQSK
ncbi:MAG: hypothetical protein ABIH23_00310 [bacterium]